MKNKTFWMIFLAVLIVAILLWVGVVLIAHAQTSEEMDTPTPIPLKLEECQVKTLDTYDTDVVFGGKCAQEKGGVYYVDANGTGLKQLVETNDVTEVKYSPNGLDVAFVSSEGIAVYYPKEFRVHYYSDEGTSISWSPKGDKLAFVSQRDGNREIYSLDLGIEVPIPTKRLTETKANESEPAWSPDGTQIAFVSERDGSDEIYVTDPDGNHQKRISWFHGDANSKKPTWSKNPSWSPDSKYLAFSSPVDVNGDYDIYRMNPDGSGVVKLTNNRVDDLFPVWSPNAQLIAYVCDNNPCVVEWNGGSVQETTEWSGGEKNIRWISNEQVAYVSYTNENLPWQIFIYDLEMRKECQLTGYLRHTSLGEIPRCAQ